MGAHRCLDMSRSAKPIAGEHACILDTQDKHQGYIKVITKSSHRALSVPGPAGTDPTCRHCVYTVSGSYVAMTATATFVHFMLG